MWLCGCVCVRVYVQFPSAWLAVEQISYTMSHVGGFTSPLHHRITEPSSQTKKTKPSQTKTKLGQHSRLGSADFRCPTTGSILAPCGSRQRNAWLSSCFPRTKEGWQGEKRQLSHKLFDLISVSLPLANISEVTAPESK